jgi:hypothetical protein
MRTVNGAIRECSIFQELDTRFSFSFPVLRSPRSTAQEFLAKFLVSRLLDGKSTTTLPPFPSVPGGGVPMPRQDSEPPMVVAQRLVHQILTIALELALPAWLGFWLDNRWGTSPWLVVLGACLGLFVAGSSFVQFVKRLTPPSRPPRSSSSEKTTNNSGPSQQ